MRSSILVRIFGWKAALHHGDPLVWDRWRWISRRIRLTRNHERLLDVGCGSGALTIGTAKLGYRSLGLSWDEANQSLGEERAKISRAEMATFQICDVRKLDERQDLIGQFDIVLCCENLEHILDDFRLMNSMAACLKPGGRLLLTTPYLRRNPIDFMDYGPFPDFEDGRHVRRGYNRAALTELCDYAGLVVEEISFVSGPTSRLGAVAMQAFGKGLHRAIGWLAILPLRLLPPLLDPLLMKYFDAIPFCIALEAYKRRV